MYNIIKNSVLIDSLISQSKAFLIRYPAPLNIGYLWNFGSMAGLFLVVQIITGLFLTMYYTPHTLVAFVSVDSIMKNINYGWLIRYIHANGASFFFFFLYLHLFRGLFFGSYKYPRTTVWFTGVTIYLLVMGTAFLGYVLPWGQMSFWAATVITNFLSVVPMVGDDLVFWLWGGFSISNATLNRFFCLHYLLPFIICIVVVLHLLALHQASSTNELRIRVVLSTRIAFHPYFIVKDLFSVLCGLLIFGVIVFFNPELFNHSVNYVYANILVTPKHIVPEWYFLPYYAILRSILDKTIGICAFALSVVMLYLFPVIDNCVGLSNNDNETTRRIAWFFILNFIFLGFLGSETTEFPCVEFGTLSTMIYFFMPFVFLPASSWHLYVHNQSTTHSFYNCSFYNGSKARNAVVRHNSLHSKPSHRLQSFLYAAAIAVVIVVCCDHTYAIFADMDIVEARSFVNECWHICYDTLCRLRALEGCTNVRHIVDELNVAADSYIKGVKLYSMVVSEKYTSSDFTSITATRFRLISKHDAEISEIVINLANNTPGLCDSSETKVLWYLFLNDANAKFECESIRDICTACIERGSVTPEERKDVSVLVRYINDVEGMHTEYNEQALNAEKMHINKQLEQLGFSERLNYTSRAK